jgi:hypothetical protein
MRSSRAGPLFLYDVHHNNNRKARAGTWTGHRAVPVTVKPSIDTSALWRESCAAKKGRGVSRLAAP